jgi:hypothetical protein
MRPVSELRPLIIGLGAVSPHKATNVGKIRIFERHLWLCAEKRQPRGFARVPRR